MSMISRARAYIESLNDRLTAWMLVHADTPRAQFWLSVVSFFEATILPLPPSTLMLAMVALGEKKRWFYLATITTLTSVLGGLFGYLIGYALYDTLGIWLITHYGLAEQMIKVGELFADNAFLAIFVGAFTPIPYKVFTIGAGFFKINLAIFTLASFLGRGLRFYVLAYLAKTLGEHVSRKIIHYFALLVIVSIGILIIFVGWQSF